MRDVIDNVLAMEQLRNRINRKQEMTIFDMHVVEDALAELKELRISVAKLYEQVNKGPLPTEDENAK